MLNEGYTIKDACFGVDISRSRYSEVISKEYKHDLEVKTSKVKTFKESDLIIEVYKDRASILGLYAN